MLNLLLLVLTSLSAAAGPSADVTCHGYLHSVGPAANTTYYTQVLTWQATDACWADEAIKAAYSQAFARRFGEAPPNGTIQIKNFPNRDAAARNRQGSMDHMRSLYNRDVITWEFSYGGE